MPEGPSLIILKEEAEIFKGKKILEVSGNAKIDQSRIKGQKVIDFKTWGKHFLICFPGFFLRIHLLMFGKYSINEKRDAAPRLSMRFGKGELNFYFCSIKLVEGEVELVYDWETDPMSDQWKEEKAVRSLKKIKNTMICDALLDQNIFSGVGNIIKTEVLFLVKVHPETLIKNLPEKKIQEILTIIPSYCLDFYKWKKAYVLRKHWQIYRSKMCPRCNIPVVLKYLGKTNRRSFFCTNCQIKY
jgi:endonuclease-8